MEKRVPIFILACLIFCLIGFYFHTARATDAWWNSSWSHRVKITIKSSQVPSTQTNFPVYVNLANLPNGFWGHIKSDGSDIRVTNNTGSELAREVVVISKGASTGELWFKADSISDSAYYYIYYGNAGASEPAATDADGSQGLWVLRFDAEESDRSNCQPVETAGGTGKEGDRATSRPEGRRWWAAQGPNVATGSESDP